VRGFYAGALAAFVPQGHACGAAANAEVQVLSTKYDPHSGVPTVDLVPLAVRSGAKRCIDSIHVATVDLAGDGCVFKTEEACSPCLSRAWNDPTCPACIQEAMGYCAHGSDDEACALFVPAFQKDDRLRWRRIGPARGAATARKELGGVAGGPLAAGLGDGCCAGLRAAQHGRPSSGLSACLTRSDTAGYVRRLLVLWPATARSASRPAGSRGTVAHGAACKLS
jgi:hypothetical protein